MRFGKTRVGTEIKSRSENRNRGSVELTFSRINSFTRMLYVLVPLLILSSPSSHQQDGPPTPAWSCSRLLLVKSRFFLPLLLQRFMLWVSVKHLETILTTTEAV